MDKQSKQEFLILHRTVKKNQFIFNTPTHSERKQTFVVTIHMFELYKP